MTPPRLARQPARIVVCSLLMLASAALSFGQVPRYGAPPTTLPSAVPAGTANQLRAAPAAAAPTVPRTGSPLRASSAGPRYATTPSTLVPPNGQWTPKSPVVAGGTAPTPTAAAPLPTNPATPAAPTTQPAPTAPGMPMTNTPGTPPRWSTPMSPGAIVPVQATTESTARFRVGGATAEPQSTPPSDPRSPQLQIRGATQPSSEDRLMPSGTIMISDDPAAGATGPKSSTLQVRPTPPPAATPVAPPTNVAAPLAPPVATEVAVPPAFAPLSPPPSDAPTATWPVTPPVKPGPSEVEIAPTPATVDGSRDEPAIRAAVVPPTLQSTTPAELPNRGSVAATPVLTSSPSAAGPTSPPSNLATEPTVEPSTDVGADGALPTAPVATAPVAAPSAAAPTPVTPVAPPKSLPTASATPPAERPDVAEIMPVDFNGITLGETTVAEMFEAWGRPLEQSTDGGMTRCRFKIEPFAAVETACVDDVAVSIVVDLGRAFAPADVTQELNLGDVTPVEVRDETGAVLGVVYPERGVSLRYDSAAAEPRVSFIGLDRIDARPFVLRAEQRMPNDVTAAFADLNTALKLEPDHARALWLKARLLQAGGKRRQALESIEAAIKKEPKGAEYLLTRAALLAESGLFSAALDDTLAVIEGTTSVPHLQAQAWNLRGNLLAGGPERDAAQALDAHTRAVRLAEPAVTDERTAVRRAAKQTVVEAHLGVAEDIAWGNWNEKASVVPKWLEKADRLAAQWCTDGDLSSEAKLVVARRAAGCFVGMHGTGDPAPWADRLRTMAETELADEKLDAPLRRHRQWECGLGLYDCLQAFHARGDVTDALRCGETAVELLAAGREDRDPLPTDAYMFGRLYFRIGSIYAVNRNDHAHAVSWFDRAAPLLERPLSDSVAADRGRQGETLVSMGVSYWSVGKRERAMELTNVGSRYMQQAVEEGSLKPETLAVPYANLATMHKQLGDDVSGKRFAEMASRAETGAGTLRR